MSGRRAVLRWLAGIAIVVVGALALDSEVAHGTRAKHRQLCVRYTCATVAADTQAEIVFVVETRRGRNKVAVGTYARWRATGRLTLLGDEENPIVRFGPRINKPLALAGRYVAFVVIECAPGSSESCGESVVRVDIKTGARVHIEGRPNMTGLVVTPAGTLAWMEGEREVRVARAPFPRFGLDATLLASSPAIDPESLALAGSHLYWTEGGQPREAKIE